MVYRGVVSSKNNKDLLLENKLNSVESMKNVINSILNYKKIGINYETGEEEEFAVENVSFSGITGEPFFSSDSLIYAIEELTKHNIKVGVFTNGTLIKKEMFDTILKMKYILISLDAGNSETYNNIKCQGVKTKNYDNILSTIENLNKRKKELNSLTDINIGYVINEYNYNQIFSVAEKLKKIGVHYLRFKTDIASILNLSSEERKEAKSQIKKVKKYLCDSYFSVVEIHNVMDSNKKTRKFDKCFIHYLVANISADANLYPCNYHPSPKNDSFGLIENETDLKDLWDNLLNNELDKKIPGICPEVCDPFKNRANRVLEIAYNIYMEHGTEYLKECIDECLKKIQV